MIRRLIFLGFLTFAACGRQPSTGAPRPQAEFDLVLENGHVVDGTGAAWFLGDVAIVGDRIARVERPDRSGGSRPSSGSTCAGLSSRPASSTSRAAPTSSATAGR